MVSNVPVSLETALDVMPSRVVASAVTSEMAWVWLADAYSECVCPVEAKVDSDAARPVTSAMSWVWSDAANPDVAAEIYAAMASDALAMSDRVWV